MNSAGFSSLGHRATLPNRVQIQATIDTMTTMRDGYDIRNYSASARKELLYSGNMDVRKKEGTEIIAVVPKLALIVISEAFRNYLVAHPEATAVYFAQENIEEKAVAHLMRWVNAITRASDKKFGVPVPTRGDETDHMFIIQIRYAAQVLGMELYVRHFVRAYKESLRQRVPSSYRSFLRIPASSGPADTR